MSQSTNAPYMHLQAQLLTLSRLCWSEPVTGTDSITSPTLMSAIIRGAPMAQSGSESWPSQVLNPDSEFPNCRWAVEGFPKGPALLSYLYAKLQESDSRAAPLVRFLFLSAFQPYTCHMRLWMYSTARVAPHFAAGNNNNRDALPQSPDNSVSSFFLIFVIVVCFFFVFLMFVIIVCCFFVFLVLFAFPVVTSLSVLPSSCPSSPVYTHRFVLSRFLCHIGSC